MKRIIVFVVFILITALQGYSVSRVTKVFNNVYYKLNQPNQDDSWNLIKDAREISSNSQLKTDSKSTALVEIDKKVIIYLRENTVVFFNQINNKIDINLDTGSILIKANIYLDDFYIRTIQGDLKIYTKNCIIKNLNNIISVSVFDNYVKATVKGKDILVNQGNGLEITPSDNNLNYFPLPSSPIVEYPQDNSIVTAGIKLKWGSVNEAILYRLEIARDINFIEMSKVEEMETIEYPINDLTDGIYYWRVSAINRKNLEGTFFDLSRFTLQQGQISSEIKDKQEDNINQKDLKNDVPTGRTTSTVILGGIILLSLIVLLVI